MSDKCTHESVQRICTDQYPEQWRCYICDELFVQWSRLGSIRQLVNAQAEDAGLWFQAMTAPEAYLQQELRKLHAAVEESPT